MTGRVKRWSGHSRRAEAGWGGRAALVNGTVEFAPAIAKILQKKFSAIYLRIKRRH
jgi:hypothetical protein